MADTYSDVSIEAVTGDRGNIEGAGRERPKKRSRKRKEEKGVGRKKMKEEDILPEIGHCKSLTVKMNMKHCQNNFLKLLIRSYLCVFVSSIYHYQQQLVWGTSGSCKNTKESTYN